MKTYFAKYLPVEGEIKEGDIAYFKDPNKHIKGFKDWSGFGTIIGVNNEMYGIDLGHTITWDDTKNFSRHKLFLCSRNIQVGDKVKSFNYPEQEGKEVVNLRTSKKLVGAEDHSEIYHLVDIQYPNEISTAAVSNFFKVIGEILTLGIIENQEFTEI